MTSILFNETTCLWNKQKYTLKLFICFYFFLFEEQVLESKVKTISGALYLRFSIWKLWDRAQFSFWYQILWNYLRRFESYRADTILFCKIQKGVIMLYYNWVVLCILSGDLFICLKFMKIFLSFRGPDAIRADFGPMLKQLLLR